MAFFTNKNTIFRRIFWTGWSLIILLANKFNFASFRCNFSVLFSEKYSDPAQETSFVGIVELGQI